MIRINLLESHKRKGGGRKLPTISFSGLPSAGVVVFLLLALGAVGNYIWYYSLDRQANKLKVELGRAEAENRRLAGVKARYVERQNQYEMYDRRVKVIHQLQANQTGPTELLATVANTVNSTDAVWLDSMNDDGKAINLKGMAISSTAVANLITNLKKTKYFKTVEIREAVQDSKIKDMQAFIFTLVCEKQKS